VSYWQVRVQARVPPEKPSELVGEVLEIGAVAVVAVDSKRRCPFPRTLVVAITAS
jgi:hypothetical protein